MNQVDDSLRKQAAEVLQSMNDRFSTWDNVPCQIEEGLFLGSIGAANNKDELKKLNVTHILTVANSLPPTYPNDFVYKVLNVTDTECTNLRQHFDECYNYIEEAKGSGGSVLVHCFVGRSRSVKDPEHKNKLAKTLGISETPAISSASVTIVLSYLMKKHGISLSHALEQVRSKRPQAAPNVGFISQLQDFEKSLQGSLYSRCLNYIMKM